MALPLPGKEYVYRSESEQDRGELYESARLV